MKVLTHAIGRYLFRFVLFYWICFIFPFPLDLVGLPFQFAETKDQPTWMKTAREYYGAGFGWVYGTKTDACKWVGENILGVTIPIQPTGSGDTLRAYVGCLCAVVSAAAAALL